MARVVATSEAAASRRSLRAFTGTALIAIFAISALTQLVPGSPWNALRDTDSIGRTPWGQRWNLFAPSPPSANLATFLVVRYRDASGTHVSDPVDLSAAMRRASRDGAWAPPKLVRVTTKLNVGFESHAYDAARLAVAGGLDRRTRLPPSFVRDVRLHRAADLETYRRLLSAAAPPVLDRPAQITGVRGVLVRTAVNTFDRRSDPVARGAVRLTDAQAPTPLLAPDVLLDVRGVTTKRVALIFDSGWMSYEPDVEPLEVDL